MVIWCGLISLIFLVATVVVIMRINSQVSERKTVLLTNLSVVKDEILSKKKLLEELAELSLGLISADNVDKLNQEIAKEEENLRSEKGRVTIAQAELEAVDIRLRELEEMERELESSNLEASRELEMLRSQEREVEVRNQKLREALESNLIQFDKLLHELANSAEAVARLNAAKTELIETQKKIEFYEGEISVINHKYMDLKRAYDALDIEYAQLYEKHSQG